MSLLIKKAFEKDIPLIQEISKITWAVTYDFLPKGQIEYMLEWMYSAESLKNQMLQDHQFFIAKINKQSIGFASVSVEKNQVYKLNKLYVLPYIQKTGAGKALLKEVILYVKNNGGDELQLQVNRSNSAKEFYLKNGFKVLFEADFEIGNGFFMNDYVMSLQL